MRGRFFFLSSLILLLGLGLVSSSSGASADQQVEVTISFTNVCESATLTIQQIVLSAGKSIDITFTSLPVRPGETVDFTRQLAFTPQRLGLSGTLDGQPFSVAFEPLPVGTPVRDQGEVGGCLEVLVTLSGGPEEQPGKKPISEGQSLQQVLQLLQLRGVSIRTEGSQTKPKLSDVSDPMLLRAIPGFSAQLIWVSSPGTLRSVIAWDDPSVDLDLLVFGFGACFQLTPPGVLAEVCDRAPFGPVPGTIFAVLVINWSPVPQAYVLSLSS